MPVSLVILAAGKGTRMKSDLPKVLHPIAHAPMLAHAMEAASHLRPDRTVVVAGHGFDQVKAAALAIDDTAQVVEQAEQNGTAHAVDMAREVLSTFDGDVVVLYGDTPFIQPETLDRMVAARKKDDLVILGFEPADPGRYGRLVMDGDALLQIVEFKDATDAERAITFCNSGLLACDARKLFDLLSCVDNNNAQGEYYLTDIVEIARNKGLSVTAIACDESETLGINSRTDLATADAVFQHRARADLLENGVTLMAADTVYLAYDTIIGRDTIIEPNVVFGPGVSVETGATIRAFSHLEGCHVSRGAVVGPYARLRPGAELAEDVRIGNFVEIKNTTIDQGAKINHLTYIGDASIGARTNVGAGTVTCNYDGFLKHRTEIGADVFIGSDTMLVAPVNLGDGAMTATGTIVTDSLEADAMAIGRVKQINRPGAAKKLRNILRAKKARRNKD